MTEPLNHHEALLYVMVASSAVDRAMTGVEFARISEIVSNLPVFADYDEEGLVKAAEACGKILTADDGVQQVVRLVREALPEKLRETAYWVALEVAAADRRVRPEEIFFKSARRRARARPHDHRGIRAVHPRPQHDAVTISAVSRARASRRRVG